MNKILLCFLLILTVAVGQNTPREVNPLPNYFLSWRFPDAETIEITMTAQASGWVGFGLGSEMNNADIYIGRFNPQGNPEVLDYFGNDLPPTLDTSMAGGVNNVLNFTGRRSGGSTSFTFTRKLNSTDIYDKNITPNAETSVIVAYGAADALNYHGPNRIPFKLNFQSGSSDNSIAQTLKKKHISHGVLMAVAWAVFVPITIIMGRYFKHIGDAWFKTHTIFNVVAFLMVISAFAIGVNMSTRQFKQTERVTISHAWIGLFVFIFMVFQMILGILAHKMWNPNREGTPWFPDRIHHWMGRILFLMAIVNIFLGLSSLGDEKTSSYLIAYGVWVGVVLLVFVILEVIFRSKKGKSNREE